MIGPGVEVYNSVGLYLGHNAIISQDAYICGGAHDFDDRRLPVNWRSIRLECYTWVCARMIALLGLLIGESAVLRAGALAARQFPSLTVWIGDRAEGLGAVSGLVPGQSRQVMLEGVGSVAILTLHAVGLFVDDSLIFF